MSSRPSDPAADPRSRVLSLVQRFGWNATAFQTLEPGYGYYFRGSDACVAYVDTGAAWVAAGPPVAPLEKLADTAAAFQAAARAVGRRSCFFATEMRFREQTIDRWRSIAIGEQPVWDPRGWSETLARHKSLREQLRRARAKGLRVRALEPSELETGSARREVLALAKRWLATRGMAEMRFLVQLEPLAHLPFRRCFVAECEGAIVGFAGVVPVPARDGWFVEDLLRDPNAPNGTTESLLDAVMGWAAAEGCSWLTLGLAPLAGEVPPVLQIVRKLTPGLYNFEGVRTFKAKLRPDSWMPIYLSYPREEPAFRSVLDVLTAFAPGGLFRFGLRTVLRGPPIVIAALAVLLVPWLLLLAAAPVDPWFGSPGVKWGWIAFDIALLLGLTRWLYRPNFALLTALACLVSADAVLTLAQAALWNVAHTHGLFEWVALAIACLMPPLAALSLWGARTRARLVQPGSS